jgi:hypothetical protein
MTQLLRSGRRIGRREFLATLGISIASLTMLGCGGQPAPAKIGQRVELGGVAVSLKGVVRRTAFSQHGATSQPVPDQVYLLCRMTVQNVSAPRIEVPPAAFTLLSAEGRIFKPLEVGFHLPSPSHTALMPGGSSSEPAVFEVPSVSNGFTLSIEPTGLPAIRFEIPSPAELPSEP